MAKDVVVVEPGKTSGVLRMRQEYKNVPVWYADSTKTWRPGTVQKVPIGTYLFFNYNPK